MALNPYQQNSVATVLRQLEQALDEIDALLRRDVRGTTYERVTALDDPQRAALGELEAQLRQELADLAARFGVRVQSFAGEQRVLALLVAAWEGLLDTRSAKLDRYGAVDPNLRTTLDPSIERLVQLVEAMMAVLRGTRP